MRKFYLTSIVLVSFIQVSYAKIFRIGYTGNPITGVDYAYNNISAAIAAASTGDTIQLYQQYWPGTTSSVTINKRLRFIGFGYFLDKNSGLQAINSPDNNYVQLTFNAGSEGTVVEGVYGYFYFNTGQITIRRCRILTCYLYDLATSTLKDISITQSFINTIQEYYAIKGVSNLELKNNYINYAYLTHSSGVFSNNVAFSPYLYSFLVKNNIISGCIIGSINVIQNNVFSSSCSVGSGTNNQFNVSLTNVFANWNFGSISADNQLALKAGSAALNAGVKNDNSATDAGIFGGETGEAYRLSGIPAVPAVYKLTANSQTANTNPYVITVSVRSNN